MKKIFLMLGAIVVLTSCGTKTDEVKKDETKKLSCHAEAGTDTLDSEFIFNKDGSKLKTASLVGKNNISMQASMTAYCTIIKGMSPEATCTATANDKFVDLNANIPIEKLDETLLSSLSFHGVKLYSGVNYNDLKTKIEATGTECD